LSGRSSRSSVSCLGLWRGLIARRTFRAGHPGLGRELLHAHGTNHLPERYPNSNALLVDRGQQELSRELGVLQVAGETERSSPHFVLPCVPNPG
jgi:hypothetical protein